MVNSVGYVLRFLAKLCRSLLCDDLFSHQPFPRGTSTSDDARDSQEGRMESGRLLQSVLCGLQVAPGVPALPGQMRLPLRGLLGTLGARGSLPLLEVHELPLWASEAQQEPARTKDTSMVPTQAAVEEMAPASES